MALVDCPTVAALFSGWNAAVNKIEEDDSWIKVTMQVEAWQPSPAVAKAARRCVAGRGQAASSFSADPSRNSEFLEGEPVWKANFWHGSQAAKLKSIVNEGLKTGTARPRGVYGFRKVDVCIRARYGDRGILVGCAMSGLILSASVSAKEMRKDDYDDGPDPGTIWSLKRSPWKGATPGKRLPGTERCDYQELVAEESCLQINQFWISKQLTIQDLLDDTGIEASCSTSLHAAYDWPIVSLEVKGFEEFIAQTNAVEVSANETTSLVAADTDRPAEISSGEKDDRPTVGEWKLRQEEFDWLPRLPKHQVYCRSKEGEPFVYDMLSRTSSPLPLPSRVKYATNLPPLKRRRTLPKIILRPNLEDALEEAPWRKRETAVHKETPVPKSRQGVLPRELIGKLSKFNGRPICFSFNLRTCSDVVNSEGCKRGLHICCQPGCQQPHPCLDCPQYG